MPSLASAIVPSASRTLALRARHDLVARRHFYQGKAWWVVKDPLALAYFRFQDEEYALLRMLDGPVSLAEMQERFERQFPPQKIAVEEIEQFLGSLHKSGLVLSGATGQGHELVRRRAERVRRERLS